MLASASLQVMTVFVTAGVTAMSGGMKSVPTMLAAVPVNRATSNCQAALSYKERSNQTDKRADKMPWKIILF
jgi:hypothetical protein